MKTATRQRSYATANTKQHLSDDVWLDTVAAQIERHDRDYSSNGGTDLMVSLFDACLAEIEAAA